MLCSFSKRIRCSTNTNIIIYARRVYMYTLYTLLLCTIVKKNNVSYYFFWMVYVIYRHIVLYGILNSYGSLQKRRKKTFTFLKPNMHLKPLVLNFRMHTLKFWNWSHRNTIHDFNVNSTLNGNCTLIIAKLIF